MMIPNVISKLRMYTQYFRFRGLIYVKLSRPIYKGYLGIAPMRLPRCDVILKKILTLQKRALRLIFFASKRSHAIPLFVASNILPVNMLYFETVSTIMHDVSTHSTPKNIRELFIHSSDRHSCLQHAFLVCR